MGATREAGKNDSGGTVHALEAGEAAAAEVEKLMKNPLRRLDFLSQVRDHLTEVTHTSVSLLGFWSCLLNTPPVQEKVR